MLTRTESWDQNTVARKKNYQKGDLAHMPGSRIIFKFVYCLICQIISIFSFTNKLFVQFLYQASYINLSWFFFACHDSFRKFDLSYLYTQKSPWKLQNKKKKIHYFLCNNTKAYKTSHKLCTNPRYHNYYIILFV